LGWITVEAFTGGEGDFRVRGRGDGTLELGGEGGVVIAVEDHVE